MTLKNILFLILIIVSLFSKAQNRISLGASIKKDSTLADSKSVTNVRHIGIPFMPGFVTTPDQLIQGKVAGVNVTSNSGSPGSGSTIIIRNGSSIAGSNF